MSLGDQIKKQLIENTAPRIFGRVIPQVDVQTTPAQIVGNVIAFLIQLVGVVFLALIVWAGYKWMTAAGDPEKAQAAISMAKNALFGLVLAFLSFLIVNAFFVLLGPRLVTP